MNRIQATFWLHKPLIYMETGQQILIQAEVP